MKKVWIILFSLLLIGCVSVNADSTLITLAQIDTATLQAAEGVFEEGTTVSIELAEGGQPVIMAETVLADVTTQRTVYDIYAIKDKTLVQPNGTVWATFAIPETYDLSKIMVYYVSNYGESELLASTVNEEDRTVTAELSHFSTFVVSEKAPPKVIEIPGAKTKKMPTEVWFLVGLGGVVLLSGIAFAIYRKRKS